MSGNAHEALRPVEEDVRIPGVGLRRVQLVYAPSFEAGFSWDIRVLDGEFLLYRSDVVTQQWRMLLRGYCRLDFESGRLEDYWGRLRALCLGVSPIYNGMAGADGTDYQLALFGDLSTAIRFTWWSDYSGEWTDLVRIADEMLDDFRRAWELPADAGTTR